MEVNKFFTDAKAMSMPLCENPFLEKILESRDDLTPKQKGQLRVFNRYGYVIIDLEVTEQFLHDVVRDMYDLIDKLPKQADGYHYNDSPRLFEGWRQSQNILQLSLNKKVLDLLRLFYGREPIPFQTINFIKGTEQPLHSYTIHFHTIPEKWVAACWIALEDMNMMNGPLRYITGSHKLPIYTLQDLNQPVPEYGKQFESYKVYEEFLASLVEHMALEQKYFLGRKGQALIWAANLLHGGSQMIDKDSTRLSQVTHYYFEGCNHYYCPLFSNLSEGIVSEKDLTKKRFV